MSYTDANAFIYVVMSRKICKMGNFEIFTSFIYCVFCSSTCPLNQNRFIKNKSMSQMKI